MKNKKKLPSFLFAISLALAFLSCNREDSIAPIEVATYEVNFTPAKTNTELEALRNDPNANLIRTQEQFDDLISARLSPLAKLSKSQILEFRTNLVFRKNVGLVGMEYAEIKKILPVEEYHHVMSLFGLDTRNGFWGAASANPSARMDVGEDKKEYKCDTKCVSAKDHICLSGC